MCCRGEHSNSLFNVRILWPWWGGMSIIGLILGVGISTGRVQQAEFYQIIFVSFPQTEEVEPDPQWSHQHEFRVVGIPCVLLQGSLPGGIKLSTVLRRSDRIIAWGQHVNTDFTLLKQFKSHQRTLSICVTLYIYYNALRNMTYQSNWFQN